MAGSPPSTVRLRPLTLPDILDESFRIYRANFTLFAGLSLALALPGLALALASGSYSVFGAAFEAISHPAATPPAFTAPNTPISLLQYPVQLALLPYQMGALLLASSRVILGGPASIPSVLRGITQRYLALMAIGLLYLAVLVTWLCLPLGIWLSVRLALAVNALLVEDAGIGSALDRSWRLTSHAFWRIFVILLLVLLLAEVVQTAVAPVFAGGAALLPGLSIGMRAALAISTLALIAQLVQPLVAIAVTLIYFDQRVRREALDLELFAHRIAQSEPAQ